ncbi:MAG: methenyltetrahydromethanopterin cyclohydrolase [Acidibrevibacterium sp.]|jgi:methenyltetrahydromethanopterin cyclohydrolase|uniref:methenyltetrahydromethanopterin cyclohydrolase n=1 Tax=Acidibrevibacterium fodinaquatile TaxID=1969806 RepID=UPI0023A824DD|nr:methenyltetrahydromethanopterin cyclohydrolase [Acidibrevibacterium fodinaquatile]MCA7120887.1 methenyltetrahydromethanopterin cyclohydrolase [Acidibrevibacterium fodinaquatile]
MTALFSLNQMAWDLFTALERDAALLRLGVARGGLGERLIDAGSLHPGGIEAGRRIAEICMGGLGRVAVTTDATLGRWPLTLTVASSQPVLACLASQYAGWSLQDGKFFALGSGPARALARKEALFAELDYQDRAAHAVLVLESAKPPPVAIIEKVAGDCGIAPDQLGVIFAPTQSLAGATQVVARVLEVALHKAHERHFPLDRIKDGVAAAPLAPPHPDFVTAMGRTNDAIIFGGRVHLFVTGPEAEARDLAEHLPSSTSRDYGKPFAEIFRAAKGDFYAIDGALFSPAMAQVTALETGRTFHSGQVNPIALDASFA